MGTNYGWVSKKHVILAVTRHDSETVQDTITDRNRHRTGILRFGWCKGWLILKRLRNSPTGRLQVSRTLDCVGVGPH